MRRLERLTVALALGGIPPLVGLLAGWWGSVPLVAERWIWLGALLGLLVGTLVDALYLRRWVRRAPELSWWSWAAVYIFYTAGAYGSFMGVPVPLAALALPAGIIVGSRLARTGALASRGAPVAANASATHLTRRACGFTTGVMAAACIASAALSLTDPHTAANLEGMLGLPFDVTPAMILGLILVGGAGLLIVQWWITALTIRWVAARAPSSL